MDFDRIYYVCENDLAPRGCLLMPWGIANVCVLSSDLSYGQINHNIIIIFLSK